MIEKILLLLGLSQPVQADTTNIQGEYIQALENANKNDSSATHTYTIAKNLVLNTPDSILSSLSTSQIVSSLQMINATLAVLDGMKNYEGLSWAPNIEFSGMLHPDSVANNIAEQIVAQGNPELFLLFYPSNDPLRKTLEKKINDAKHRILSELPKMDKGYADVDVTEFSFPVVNRNGLSNLTLLYSKKYEDVYAVGALFSFVDGGDLFSLKIYEERYFQVISLFEYAAQNKFVLDAEFVKYALSVLNMDSRKFYALYGSSNEYLIFEKDSVYNYVQGLKKDTSMFPKPYNSEHVSYKGKIMQTYEVKINGAYYNYFVLSNLYPKPSEDVNISIRYAGDISVLKGYLAGIEKYFREKKETAEALLAALVFASENNIPLCDAFLSDYYELITRSVLISNGNTSFVVEANGRGKSSLLSDGFSNNGHNFEFSIYPKNFYITGNYNSINEKLIMSISYFAPNNEKIEGITYRTEITIFNITCVQARELESVLKRWEDVYKNSKVPDDRKKLIKDLYEELLALNDKHIGESTSIRSLLPKTIANILNLEAKQLEDKKTKTDKSQLPKPGDNVVVR